MALSIGLFELQGPSPKLLPVPLSSIYPAAAIGGMVTSNYSVRTIRGTTVYPFQVQYSVDGHTYGYLDDSSPKIVPAGTGVTVARDTRNPSRAAYVP
jgi:hypothetical protein